MNFSYYAFDDEIKGFNTCSAQSDEYPLLINNAGNLLTQAPFTTDNVEGRKDFYLLYLVRGRLRVFLEEGVWEAAPGDIFLFPPRYRYRYEHAESAPLEYYYVHFTGSYAEHFLQDCGFSPLPYAAHTPAERHLSQNILTLLEQTQRQDPLRPRRLACTLEHILLTIAEERTKTSEKCNLEASLQVIHNEYASDLRIPALAKLENLSNSRYVELFRQKNGLSPNAYLIRLRIRVACDLLTHTDLPIREISATVGYPDSHFFCKLFKKHMKISPTQYRNQSHSPF